MLAADLLARRLVVAAARRQRRPAALGVPVFVLNQIEATPMASEAAEEVASDVGSWRLSS